ncbi:MAG: DUF2855 family protein [Comamonadaceae bacterium]|nr:DUF2855 family protein [Comamonadaceae bacterium]
MRRRPRLAGRDAKACRRVLQAAVHHLVPDRRLPGRQRLLRRPAAAAVQRLQQDRLRHRLLPGAAPRRTRRHRRSSASRRPATWTSRARSACYDKVLTYDAACRRWTRRCPRSTSTSPATPRCAAACTNTSATRSCYSSSIGGTHWAELGAAGGLPGPRPVLFFAPAQIERRSAPPPEGWGRDALQQRLGAAWTAFLERVGRADDPWLHIVTERGARRTGGGLSRRC